MTAWLLIKPLIRFDSDPRLQVLMRVHQGVTPGGMATVSETVSKPARKSKFATTCQYLLKLAKTRVHKRAGNRTGFMIRIIIMKSKFILFRRAGVFYSEDTTTGKQHSLRTKDEAEALAILHSKNEAHRQPVLRSANECRDA
jgi:hypothetical protein